jgi:cytochrome oxidase Cu insertion factor (SCO1/SenC/PrrC family)
VYGSVPDFTLVDQHNHPLRKTDLEGKIWVANFMFTNCPDECPLMTAAIAQLQSDLADVLELRLVSITVDPERDTPAVLAQYAQRFQADPQRWFFLTGDKRAIYHLARQGFRLGIVDPTEHTQPSPSKSDSSSPSNSALDPQVPELLEGTFGWRPTLPHWWDYLQPSSAFANHGRARDTLHSTRFVLVDQRAQIRGYYDSQEDADLQRLRQHLQILRRVT